jgi:hypothetical protein
MATSRGLDERKLANELVTAVEGDRRRIAVDDMKKRSVMTARSYDEFRHLVACAEDDQKPLTSKELEMLGKRKPGDNQTDVKAGGVAIPRVALRSLQKNKRNATTATVAQDAKASKPMNAPTSAAEFLRVWRRGCTTPSDKCRYMQMIPGERATQLFQLEVPDVGEVAEAWSAGLLTSAEGECDDTIANRAVDFLDGLVKAPGFGMCMLMTSATNKTQLQRMFGALLERIPMDMRSDVVRLAQKFEVSLDIDTDGVKAA